MFKLKCFVCVFAINCFDNGTQYLCPFKFLFFCAQPLWLFFPALFEVINKYLNFRLALSIHKDGVTIFHILRTRPKTPYLECWDQILYEYLESDFERQSGEIVCWLDSSLNVFTIVRSFNFLVCFPLPTQNTYYVYYLDKQITARKITISPVGNKFLVIKLLLRLIKSP